MPSALITGAGGRLGQAMALKVADLGYDVAVHYASSEDGATQTANGVRDLGRAAATLQADLLNHDQTCALVGQAAEALGGPLDLLINNASIFEYDRIETATLEGWDRHVSSNLRAPFFLTQAFADQAPEARIDEGGEPEAQASVINMIDQRVRKLTPEFATYTIAKVGLWGLTQTAAQALAPKVRVNAIAPGPTLRGGRQSEAHFAKQRAATILSRGADPEGICDALSYLLVARAVTGQMICVDGGQHLGWETPDVIGTE